MKRTLLIVLASCSALGAADTLNQLDAREQSENYELLFDGKDLSGWEGDPRLWSVRDGMIVGSTEGHPIEQNSFLVTNNKFSDFILKIDVKLRNHNSGIQFRSEALPSWAVRGYQADAAEGNWWGSIYGEKTGRGVILNGWQGKGESVVRPGDWNHYEITCKGKRITLSLNGLVTADIEDDMALEGIIALQLHRGPPMEVYFRNIKIKRLK